MSRARGGTSVMAACAPADVEEDDPQTKLWRQLNFLPTPPWAARAMAELILQLDPQARSVWECACGTGTMAEPLKEYFDQVHASDVYPHGYGEVRDFLSDDGGPDVDWICSNPPFKAAQRFIELALRRARRGVAMLLRFQFLEADGRYELLYGAEPMTVFAPFIDRVPMILGRWNPKASSATAYGLFVWVKGMAPLPIMPIPPGTKLRLSRPDDARRFSGGLPLPLFEDL